MDNKNQTESQSETKSTNDPLTNMVKSASNDTTKKEDNKSTNKRRPWHKNKRRNGKDGYDRSRDNKHHKWNHGNTSKRTSYSDGHLKFQPKVGKEQTLDLEIYSGAEIRSNGLYPISGGDLPKKDISIDWFKEVPATANGALNNMATDFQNADINLASLEADTLDTITVQVTAPTYAQLPHPSWVQLPDDFELDNLVPAQPWPGYGDQNYTTYTTQRAIQLRAQINTMVVAMQTNQSFANLTALNYWICPYVMNANADTTVQQAINDNRLQDLNPFWQQSYDLGLLGWIDGANTAMLQAVTRFYNIQRAKVLLEYFIKRHNTFAPYLKTARGFLENRTFTAVVEAIADELSYIYCDTKWVNDHAKALLAISKSTDSVWSPIIVPTPTLIAPAYSMVGNNGNGLWFSLTLGNNNGRDGAVTPYYTNHATNTLDNLAYAILWDLQVAAFNANGAPTGPAMTTIQNNWCRQFMMNYVNTLLHDVQSLKQQLSGYNSLIEQGRASGLIWYEKKKWKLEDADIEVKYIPQIAIPLQHPECMITNTANISGQFPAEIALERDRVETALIDSTRYYAICPEWFFSLQINNFDLDMPAWVHVLQFDNIQITNADTGEIDFDDAAVAANGTVAGVFQLPELIMYGWIEVRTLNGAAFRFRHWKNFAQQLNAANVTDNDDGTNTYYVQELTWRGSWALSNGTIYLMQNEQYAQQDFYTNYGMGGDDPVLIESFWLSSFTNLVNELGILTADSSGINPNGTAAEQNYISSLVIRQNYVVSMPVTMRNTDIEMLMSLIQHSMLVAPIPSGDVGNVTKTQAITPVPQQGSNNNK